MTVQGHNWTLCGETDSLQQETVVVYSQLNKQNINIRNYPYSQHSSECSWWRVWVSHWCVPERSAASVSGQSPTGSPLPRSASHPPAFLKHNTRAETESLMPTNVYKKSLIQHGFNVKTVQANESFMIQLWYSKSTTYQKLWHSLHMLGSTTYQIVSAGPVHRTDLQPDPSQWSSPPPVRHLSSRSTPTWAE